MPPNEPPLPPVIYEDDWLIAFDKPSGLPVAPDHWDKSQEHLMGLVHRRLSPQIANAHRIDRDTSGVLLCAKTLEALRAVRELFDTHRVDKGYLALTRPAPAEDRGSIVVAISPDGRRPGRMRATRDAREGKDCRTDYEVLERSSGGRWALVRLRPLTDRTHQVRVHLAYLGCPILCDALYGDGAPLRLSELKHGYKPKGPERPLIGRLALHAESLLLPHPATGVPLAITAPLPADFALALKQLRRWAAR